MVFIIPKMVQKVFTVLTHRHGPCGLCFFTLARGARTNHDSELLSFLYLPLRRYATPTPSLQVQNSEKWESTFFQQNTYPKNTQLLETAEMALRSRNSGVIVKSSTSASDAGNRRPYHQTGHRSRRHKHEHQP